MTYSLVDLDGALPQAYALEREIGHGGMAVVWLAKDLVHQRRVAIKVLRPDLARCIGPGRFLREIEIVSSLTHPHILPLLDSGVSGDLVWYVMPYVEGESLRQLLRRERQLPIDRAVAIAEDVASALSWAHKQGIVHRDIKPENILLEEGEAVVADFGIARAVTDADAEQLTATGLVVGTPAYMSPEQAQSGLAIDGRSDLYSLGCTLYEMLAGEPPFHGATSQAIVAQHLGAPVPSLRIVRRTVPGWLENVIVKTLAKVPADRFDSADELVAALRTGGRSRPHALRKVLLGAVAVGVLVLAAFMARYLSPPSALRDENLVAVAPFAVFDDDLRLWGEGMMDVLSSSLDGAGSLRTVSPSVVLRDWSGRSELTSAQRLARRTGASLVIVGRLVRGTGDTVRANAVLMDPLTGARRGEVEVRDVATRLDRLGDSLTIAILGETGQTSELGTQRLSSLGATSLPALKAFLRGEHFLRLAVWDSAIHSYGAAVKLDSAFALALWRLHMAHAWRKWGLYDPVASGYALKAGARNHGLAPRESLLITVDSLWASLSAEDSLVWQRTRRLFSTLDEAARLYPGDPFVWFQTGEARYHLAPPLDFTMSQSLEAFDRAIALDSGFAVAYLTHPVQLALVLRDVRAARRYTQGYLRVSAPGVEDSAARLTDLVLSVPQPLLDLDSLTEGVSADVLYRAATTLDMWFDSSETAVRLARLMVQDRPPSPHWGDERTLRLRYARLLAQRGHLQESWSVLRALVDTLSPPAENLELFTELALLGIVPAGLAQATFRSWLRASPRGAIFALPWWAQVHDTIALRGAVEVQDSLATHAGTPAARLMARYGAQAGRAYSALAGGDTTAALTRFAALPDSMCQDCYLDWWWNADLLLQRGRPKEAGRLLNRVVTFAWTAPSYAGASLLLGRAEEQVGDRAAALRAYRATVAAWVNADQVLVPKVRLARAAIARLRAESD